MKLALSATGVLAVAGVAVLGLVVWKGSSIVGGIPDALAAGAHAVDPFNPDNVVAGTVNKVINLGNSDPAQETNLGGALWEVDNWLRDHNPFTAKAS